MTGSGQWHGAGNDPEASARDVNDKRRCGAIIGKSMTSLQIQVDLRRNMKKAEGGRPDPPVPAPGLPGPGGIPPWVVGGSETCRIRARRGPAGQVDRHQEVRRAPAHDAKRKNAPDFQVRELVRAQPVV